MTATLTTFSARDAKARFGEVLDEALGHPVGITRHDRLTAYIVSKKDFDSLLQKVQELEDQLWLAKAEQARAGGYASAQQVDAFLNNFRNLDNEVRNDKPGSQDAGEPRR